MEEDTAKLLDLKEKQLFNKLNKATSLSESVLSELKKEMIQVAMKKMILRKQQDDQNTKPMTKTELNDLVKKGADKTKKHSSNSMKE